MDKSKEILSTFKQNKQNLVSRLDESIPAQKNRMDILKSFELDNESIKSYISYVYEDADEEDIRSCQDVIENGPDSLLGMISNIAAQFTHMMSMINEIGMHEFDDRASQMIRSNHGDENRIEKIIKNLKILHKDDQYLPSIEETDLLEIVIKNLKNLNQMLINISNCN